MCRPVHSTALLTCSQMRPSGGISKSQVKFTVPCGRPFYSDHCNRHAVVRHTRQQPHQITQKCAERGNKRFEKRCEHSVTGYHCLTPLFHQSVTRVQKMLPQSRGGNERLTRRKASGKKVRENESIVAIILLGQWIWSSPNWRDNYI